MSDNIKVAVRVRPLIQRERDQNVLWEVDDDGHIIKTKDAKPYMFDRVFNQIENTDYVYAAIALPIVEGAMEGFHGTIFAYGQTSSGKTFTMMGTDEEPGIIKQAVAEIFNTIENTPSREFLIRASYMEIYNENVSDLLSDKLIRKNLDIREDQNGQVYVPELKEEIIQNVDQIFNIMKIGDANRHVGATNMNEQSSRSHSIFRVIIESKDRDTSDADGAVNVSHLNLVDLAGSEKARNTGAVGQRLVEGGYINKSLFTLGKIISQLSDGAGFVNYRDSKLTRILQNSLGGNSKTAIICNVTPASLEETHSTLRFATSAKKIRNKAIVNEVLSDEAMLKRYKNTIRQLTKELEATKTLEAVAVAEENQELKQTLSQQQDKIARLTQLICTSSKIQDDKTGEKFTRQRKRRETWCPGKARSVDSLQSIKSDIPSHIDLANSSWGFPRRQPNPKFHGSKIATRNSAPVDLIDEEQMPVFDTSIAMDTSLATFTQTLHKEFDEEVNRKGKTEEMESRISDLRRELTESLEISEELARQNEKLKSYEEMAESQFKNLNARVRSLETELDLKNEDLLKKEQKLIAMEEEMADLQDFIGTEKMMKEDSFMAKQFGEDMVDELRARIAELEQTQKESEEYLLDTRKQLALTTDDKILLQQQIVDLQKENEHLDSDKQDFDAVFEMERNKHKQREQELLQQLELVYAESGAERATTPTPCESERSVTPTPDGVRCKELEQQIEELKDELQQNENMQEQLIIKLQDAEAKIESFQASGSERRGSESHIIDDSMTLEMKQFGLPSIAPVPQDAPLHWEMEEARLNAENGELARNLEELKKELLSVQLEKTEMEEKMNRLYETSRHHSLEADGTVSEAESELLQKISLLNNQLETAEEAKKLLDEDLKCSVEATIDAQDDLLTTKNELSQVKNELQHALVRIAEQEADRSLEKRESVVRSPGKELANEQLSVELTEARDKITQLEFELDQAKEEMSELRHSNEDKESHDGRIHELKEQLDSAVSAKVESEEKVIELEDQLSTLKSQFPGELEGQHLSEDLAEAKDKITQLEFELDQAKEEMAEARHHNASQESHDERINELKEQLDDVIGSKVHSEERVIELEDQLAVLQNQLEKGKEMYQVLQSELNERVETIEELENKSNSSATKKGDGRLDEQLAEERKAFVELEKKYGKLLADQKHKSDRLLSETNRDMNSQRRIQELENERREAISSFQQISKENQQIIDARDKEIYELKTRLQKSDGECELAQHNEKKAQEQIATLKQDIRDLEDLHTHHETSRGRQDMDPDKMADKIKKLSMSADLSQQRASKYETRIKVLEAEAKKTEDIAFQKNNLQRQLREVEHSLQQREDELKSLQNRFTTSHADALERRMEIDSLKEKLDKVTCERDSALADRDMILEEKNASIQQKEKLLGELQQVSAQAAEYKKQVSKNEEGRDTLMQRLCDDKDKLQADYEKLQVTVKQLQSERENLLQQIEQAKSDAEEAKKCLLGQEDEMDSIQGHLNSQLTEMQSTQKQELLDIENKHQSYVSELEAVHKCKLEESEVQLRQELSTLTDQHTAEINDLKMSHCKELEAAEAKVKDLKDELVSLLAKGSDIDVESIQERHQGDLLTLETQLRDEMDELIAKYESEAAVKQALHDQVMSDIETKHAEALSTMKANYEQKLLDLEGEHIRQHEELERTHQRDLEDCITANKEEMSLARTEQKAEMKQLESKLDAEMQELQEQLVIQTEDNKQEKLAWTAKLEDELAAASAQHSQQLKAQEHSYKQQIEALETKYTELLTTKACASNKETEERIQDLIKHYEDEKNVLEEKYQEIIQVKTEETSEMKYKVDNATKELSDHKEISDTLFQEVNDLKEEIRKKSGTVSTLTEQISELSGRLMEKNNTIDQMQEQLQKLELQHAEDKLELEVNLKEEYHLRISEVEASTQSETMGQMELAQSEAADLKECLDMALHEKEELENKITTLESRLERKETECIELQAHQGSYGNKDLDILEKRIFTLEGDNKYLRENNEKVEKVCDELDEENEGYQEEIRKLKAKLQGSGVSNEEIEMLKSELEERKSEIKALKVQISNSGANTSSHEIGELKKMIVKEKENVEYYIKQKDHLEEINDTLEEENDQFKSQIDALKNKLRKLEKHTSSSPSVENLQDVLTKTKKDLAESKLKNNQLANELLLVADPLKKKIKEMSKENSHLNERCQNLKSEVRRLKSIQPDDSIISKERPRRNSEDGSSSTFQTFKLECEKDTLEREKKHLKNQLDEKERAIKTMKLVESELKSQLADSNRKYRRIKDYCAKLKSGESSKALTEMLNSPKKEERTDKGAVGGTENQSAYPDLFSRHSTESVSECQQQ